MNTELSHESSNQLIPWYVNGTLSPEENASLERHLESCAACRSEVQWMREVGASMNDAAKEAPAMRPSFDRALAAVERWERSKSQTRHGWFLNFWRALWNPSLPIARVAMAAQFALIAVLCTALWYVHREVKPTYTVLSGSETANAGGAKLTVSFAPGATVEQVQQIVGDVGGNIVSGPSANGIFIVQLHTAANKDAEIEATIQKLRANNAIRFVERLP